MGRNRQTNELLKSHYYSTSMPAYIMQAIDAEAERLNTPKARVIHNALIEYLHLEKPKQQAEAQE
jgi:hypothetical protein